MKPNEHEAENQSLHMACFPRLCLGGSMLTMYIHVAHKQTCWVLKKGVWKTYWFPNFVWLPLWTSRPKGPSNARLGTGNSEVGCPESPSRPIELRQQVSLGGSRYFCFQAAMGSIWVTMCERELTWTNKQAGIRRERGYGGIPLAPFPKSNLVKVHQTGESSRIPGSPCMPASWFPWLATHMIVLWCSRETFRKNHLDSLL